MTKTIKKATVQKAKAPPKKVNIQAKSQVNLKSKTKDIGKLLKENQKKKLKGLKNPVDKLEEEVRSKMNTQNAVDLNKFDRLAQEIRRPSKDTFKKLFNEMDSHSK